MALVLKYPRHCGFADPSGGECPRPQTGHDPPVPTDRPNPLSRSDHYTDHWVWNNDDKSSAVTLSADRTAAYFHTDPVIESTGAASVRGTKGFRDGEHYWEVRFLEPAHGTSVMVGVATGQARLGTTDYHFTNLIGADEQSWGFSYKGTVWHGGKARQYCDPFYDVTTVIGIYLNLYTGTLTFYKNGRSLGVAFTGLNDVEEDIYPVISSTGSSTEMEVGRRTCRYLSLQEKCFLTVARHLCHRDDVNQLPLPPRLKTILSSIK